ncbi:MAG: hypothetical protein N3E38_02145 [Candidatus Aenigmarchaeota archaeon]|nr:hypothetical protein [Candidatus Aenigmarchaeota archaeon]
MTIKGKAEKSKAEETAELWLADARLAREYDKYPESAADSYEIAASYYKLASEKGSSDAGYKWRQVLLEAVYLQLTRRDPRTLKRGLENLTEALPPISEAKTIIYGPTCSGPTYSDLLRQAISLFSLKPNLEINQKLLVYMALFLCAEIQPLMDRVTGICDRYKNRLNNYDKAWPKHLKGFLGETEALIRDITERFETLQRCAERISPTYYDSYLAGNITSIANFLYGLKELLMGHGRRYRRKYDGWLGKNAQPILERLRTIF